MKNKKLVSVVILSYKNYNFLYDALDSVFSQTYPNIEIVISNDGSKDFEEVVLSKYITLHKPQNIRSVVINNNEQNVGTVANFNKAVFLSTGEYITFLAADDTLASEDVIDEFVKCLESEDDLSLVHSAVRLYDMKMEKGYQTLPTLDEITLFSNKTPIELYNEIAVRGCFFPTTCCIKRMVYDKIGKVSENVKYIEDWSLYLQVFRAGLKTKYLNKVTLKHRDGGICHGGETYGISLNQGFKKDELTIIHEEILENLTLLTPHNQKVMQKKYKRLVREYYFRFGAKGIPVKDRVFFFITGSLSILLRIGLSLLRHIIDAFLNTDNQKKLCTLALLLLIIFAFRYVLILPYGLSFCMVRISQLLFVFHALLSLVAMLVKIIYPFLNAITKGIERLKR